MTRDASSFRPDIEGLRAIAILLVVAFHVGVPGCGGGYVGVDVFFVLSGYLITGKLHDELTRAGRLGYAQFYARRVRRLLPASAVVLIATVGAAVALLSPLELNEIGRTARSVAAYASNLWFAHGAFSYLGATGDADPMLHTWSLAVEEQFYLVWPILLAVLARLGTRFRASTRLLIIGMAAVTAASFALCIWLTRHSQPWAFYGSPARFWEFGLGGLAAIAPLRATCPRWRAVLALGGTALVLGSACVFGASSQFPGVVAAIPTAGTAMLLRVGRANPEDRWLRPLRGPTIQWLGRRSYSWYLWHWPAIALLRVVRPEASLAVAIAAALGSLLLAHLTFGLIEDPIRRSLYLRARPWCAALMVAVYVAGGIGLGQALLAHSRHAAHEASERRFADAKHDLPAVYSDGCVLDFAASSLKRDCVYGDRESKTTIALFGDSHAAQWFPAVEALAKARKWKLLVYTKVSCPSAILPGLHSDRLHRRYTECVTWRDAVLAELAAIHPTLVIMSNADSYAWGDASGVTMTDWMAGLSDAFSRVRASTEGVIELADTPRPGFDVPICLSRAQSAWFANRSCTFAEANLDRTILRVAERATAPAHGATWIDLDDRICAGSPCPVERGDQVMYMDSNHLAAGFVRTLGPALSNALHAAGW